MTTIPIEKLTPCPWNPRYEAAADVESLADSLRECGMVQPIVARPKGRGYEVVAGHRRLAAAQKGNGNRSKKQARKEKA